MYAELMRKEIVTKQCTKCKIIKPLARFQKNLRYAGGYHTWCKDCKLQSQREHKDTTQQWARKNSHRCNDLKREYALRHRGRVLESKRKWSKANPKRVLANCRKYQAAKLCATPAWLSTEQIIEMQKIYLDCPVGFEIDHIVPLRGKSVRGLHVPWNLQCLKISDNRRKSNKYCSSIRSRG